MATEKPAGTVSEAIDRAVQQLGYTAVKDNQRKVVKGLVDGKDVFATSSFLFIDDNFRLERIMKEGLVMPSKM